MFTYHYDNSSIDAVNLTTSKFFLIDPKFATVFQSQPSAATPKPVLMLELTRITRLPLSPLTRGQPATNGLVGQQFGGVGAVAEFEVTCTGVPAKTGYLVDITVIDRAVRDVFQTPLRDALRAEAATDQPTDLLTLLALHAPTLAARLPAPLTALVFRQSAFHAIRLEWDAPESISTVATATSRTESPMHAVTDQNRSVGLPTRAVFLETFEFAASHRLALREKSDAENRVLFGKCSNPNGHGHNYRLEVAVARNHAEIASAAPIDFPTIERVVEEVVMRRFDHKHLNLDCPEFLELNPSVENIAVVLYGLLQPAFALEKCDLRFVRVWETDKTSCRYPA